MIERLVFASNNEHKLEELRAVLRPGMQLLSLADAGIVAELPETGRRLEDNALEKARAAWERCHVPVVADDSGLEVACLSGAPGVDTAHYAGSRDALANMRKLLLDMQHCGDRKAQFRTVLALVTASEERLFEGVVQGHIATEMRGAGGFGYDPIFVPEGEQRSFAEMRPGEKHALSHRSRAMGALQRYLSGR